MRFDEPTARAWRAGTVTLVLALGLAGCENERTEPIGRLDPKTIPQFTEPLVVPPAMPSEGIVDGVERYEIAVRQFRQQILPPGLPDTPVWGYGRASDPQTLHTPSFTIEARRGDAIRVAWINDLVDEDGDARPHLLPVDRTLHWANPEGPPDSEGSGDALYEGPVPIVTHVHGAHVPSASDGNPLAWYLPAADDVPDGWARQGTRFDSLEDLGPGAAVFEYPNDRRAETLWFHDHALGITRVNVYAGLAGFWLVRDEEEAALGLPGPAPARGDAAGTRYYEIPIAIQDRSFHTDGTLAYPDSRAEFDGYEGPYLPDAPVSPRWNPEVFGDTMVVNGGTWPYLEVEPRLYRIRLLNGCNARTLRLRFEGDLPFHQIGNEGGLLSGAPVVREDVLFGPGERADVLVDFSTLSPGDTVRLLNEGPDEPYQGEAAQQPPADPATTGRVLEVRVIDPTGEGTQGAIPETLPAIAPLEADRDSRDLTLNEIVYEAADIPVEAELGTAADGPLGFEAPPTETPLEGTTEIWRLTNLTADVHPIHLHLVMFQVLDRTPFDAEAYGAAQEAAMAAGETPPVVDDFVTGPAVPREAWENGFKDTVLAYPGEVTRIVSRFDIAGLYVWHCHILEHEDNEMMRPFEVRPLGAEE